MEHESIPTQPRDVGFDAAIEQSRQSENGRDDGAPRAPERLPTRGNLPVPGRRTQEFSLPAPYRGYKFTAWINSGGKLADDISSDSQATRTAAFARIILAHNGWPDPETGDPLPQWDAGDAETFREFWEAIPQELRLAIQAAIGGEVGNVALSVQERRRR